MLLETGIFDILLIILKGNKISNDFWEKKCYGSINRPTIYSTNYEYEKFVHNKYIKRIFAPKDSMSPSEEYLLKGVYNNTK